MCPCFQRTQAECATANGAARGSNTYTEEGNRDSRGLEDLDSISEEIGVGINTTNRTNRTSNNTIEIPVCLQGVWPPEPDDLPFYIAALLVVWIAIYLLARTKRTAADEVHERRRLVQMLDEMKLAKMEHSRAREELKEYTTKTAAFRKEAKSEGQYQRSTRTSGFIGVQKYVGAVVLACVGLW